MNKNSKNDNLNELIKIYEGESNLYNKLFGMCKICGSSTDFYKKYLNSVNEGNVKLIEIYSFYKECEKNGLVDDIKYYIKNENKMKCCKYAEFIISEYIKYKENYNTYKFFNRMGINEEIFNYCENIVKEYNDVLYNNYCTVRDNNIIKYRQLCFDNMKNILVGIETGATLQGIKFADEVFWNLVPFREKEDFENEILKYVSENFTEYYCVFNYYFSNLLKSKKKDIDKRMILIP